MYADMTSLDLIGIRVGTNKSRLYQNYLMHYERMMERFRDRPITLLEIGVDKGASLRLWETYFPLASIVAVDIEPKTQRFAHGRVVVEIGSQFDGDFLSKIAGKYCPDIIIDDGSHIDEHQIFSFRNLFHAVNPGGLYIVEDIRHTTRSDSAADYFSALQRRVLLRQNKVKEGGAPNNFNPADISHVEIIPSAVAIWKRVKNSLDEDFCALEKLADQAELPESLLYLAQYIRRNKGPLSQALSIAQRASAVMPKNPWIHLEISKILVNMGNTQGAIKAAKLALELAHNPRGEAIFREHLARISQFEPISILVK